MKKLFLICLVLGICLNSYAYEERDILQKKTEQVPLKGNLLINYEWVSYPDYTNRSAWDALTGDNKDSFIKRGEEFLNYEWKVVPATAYMEFERSGNRNVMQNPQNSNVRAIATLFLAELAEGKGRFTEKLVDGVYSMCETTSWALSAHLVVQKSKRSLPDHTEHVIDLTSGNIASMMSWIYYFFHAEFDKINPVISKRIEKEINDRILVPYMENTYWWMAENVTAEKGMVNNWNPWCNSNVLQCFLLMEKDIDKMYAGVYKTLVSVDKFINYTNLDGACEEGPAYWGHAAGKMYDYLQILHDATNGKLSVFNEPIIKNMGEYISNSYVGDGWVVNFADASAKGGEDYRMIFRYGKAVNSTNMMQFAAYLKNKYPRRLAGDGDAYRTLQNLNTDVQMAGITPEHIHKPYVWYPQTEFCYMSKGKAFFAAKGGYNDESHNHNDIGTFNLYIENTPVFIDAGVGTYTRQTFGRERYTIWTMQSDYHNLPKINGYSQRHGKQYKAENTRFDNKKNVFSLDIANAYPKEAGINKWVRSYKFGDKLLEITDNFDLSDTKDKNVINFLTWGNVNISEKGEVKIRVNNHEVVLQYNKADFTPSVEEVELDDTRLSRVWGEKIYKVSLTAEKNMKKGNYLFKIKY